MKHIPSLPDGPFSCETTARVGEHDGKGHVYILDATGRKIASLWGPADVKMALAELIIEARNRAVAFPDGYRFQTKIQAIKAYRTQTGASLKDGVDWANANRHLWEETAP